MSDTPSSSEHVPPPIPAGGPPSGPAISDKEIADGKTMAILCYAINFVGFPFWIIPLIMRDNSFSLYHAKQCLVAWLLLAIGVVISIALSFLCIGALLLPIVGVLGLILNVFGVMNAASGKAVPLPVVGALGESWFSGLKKAGT